MVTEAPWSLGIIRFVNMQLESDEIKLDDFIIRKPLEEEEKEYITTLFPWIRPNLTIMQTEFIGNHNEIQGVIHKAELILLLFKTAITYCTSYEKIQDSQPHPHRGNYIFGAKFMSVPLMNLYFIKKDEEKQLKTFWHELYQKLPKTIEKSEEYYLNAYWRYYDSLLYSVAIERRITDVIMGLEALYLNEELSELKYRVKMRLGKIFALLDSRFTPSDVAADIDNAYEIRNKYAHGASTARIKIKIDSKDQYDDGCNTLFIKVLDYLRKSIILMFFCDKNKGELIKLIDNSLIDPNSEKELNKILKKCKILI